jgi:hypothetical protein
MQAALTWALRHLIAACLRSHQLSLASTSFPHQTNIQPERPAAATPAPALQAPRNS